jgi:AcrR family transcriptional regulator
MGKGETTRQAILDRAFDLARQVGLQGLTIGRLADELDLSKSGLFAHFQSKDALQVQVLEAAAARFIDSVVRPALAAPRGLPRLRALFEHWVEWEGLDRANGGCIFVQAAAELDDQPGLARDRLVQLQRDWIAALATAVEGAIREGHFSPSADPEQFAHDLNGIILACHHAARLLGDPLAETRARRAFETLVAVATRKTAGPDPRRPGSWRTRVISRQR